MKKLQFRVLYREFLFRIVDLELLSSHAEGDSRTLLGQFAALLVFCSVILAGGALLWSSNSGDTRLPLLMRVVGGWTMEHFLVATTMLAVGLFAVLSWESTFPDRRDLLVLGPLPVRARTLFVAKVAAVASALGLTLVSLHAAAGLTWPFALANSGSTSSPALIFDPPRPPVRAAEFPAVMDRDIAPLLRRLDLAAADGGAGIVIGISEGGSRRVMAYGVAKPDSLFEIASITKTFTGLLLAQMAVPNRVDLGDPVRDLLPPGTVARPPGLEITLLDLATHRSGLARMPDNTGPGNRRESYRDYKTADLYAFLKRRGLGKGRNPQFEYSNLGFAVLGAALENRAGRPYAELLRNNITEPLGMRDTAIALAPEQAARFLTGHGPDRLPTGSWDLFDAFAAAGGIRSTAGDMLQYLEAQLDPERTPFPKAIVESQRLRGRVAGRIESALAWQYNPDEEIYAHDGATGGFTSACFFNPRRKFAAVVLLNAAPFTFPFVNVLGAHVKQRLAGEPALSLAPVLVPAASPLRSFAGYWISMIAAGVFIFCCVLGLQGIAAQVLPRRWFLRASAFLQIAIFCLLIVGYFQQRSPATILISGPRQPWTAWIPSYWFVALYQQIAGSLHPALAPFARRAWVGLGVAVGATAIAYAASYFRTLRRIVEEPDLAPDVRSRWLPRFGAAFETAIVHFSVRTLLRSRQHRMIFAFYLGVALAVGIFFLNAPREIAGPPSDNPWQDQSVPLLATTILTMGLWVVGARVVFSLPLDLRANWIFRVTPFDAGQPCLRARRRAMIAVAIAPALAVSAAIVLPAWPVWIAAAHLFGLACLGIVLAEFSVEGVLKLPFTCSYLPGRSNFNVTFLLWLYMILAGVLGCAVAESRLLQSPPATAALLTGLGTAALATMLRNNRLARPAEAELRFEEERPGSLVSLRLS